MHLLIYTSRYTGADITSDLADIAHSAKQHNPTRDITGLLFFHGGQFLQFLEGEQAQLNALMGKINQDPRHADIQRLIDSPIIRRDFQQWNMDSFDLSEKDSILPQELKKISEIYLVNQLAESKALSRFFRLVLQNERLRKNL